MFYHENNARLNYCWWFLSHSVTHNVNQIVLLFCVHYVNFTLLCSLQIQCRFIDCLPNLLYGSCYYH